MTNIKLIFLICSLLFISIGRAGEALVPGTKELGTKEDTKLITSVALWYMEIRNTVRDAYETIQYTKAMAQNLDNMKEWYSRNKKAWKGVGTRMHQLVTTGSRWDDKLLEVEELFDAIDYQLFEETSNLDHLVNSQEKFFLGANTSLMNTLHFNEPNSKEFLTEIKKLYFPDPETNYLASDLLEDPEAARAFNLYETQRKRQREKMVDNWQSGKMVKATLLNASLASAKMATIKRMQKKRTDKFMEVLSQLSNPNSEDFVDGAHGLGLKQSLTTIYDTQNELDYATLQLIEMELYFNQLGMSIFDATEAQGTALEAVGNLDRLHDYLEPKSGSVSLNSPKISSSVRNLE